MKILVTGGNGFIGSHLCEKLVSEGYCITSLDHNFNDNSKNVECDKIKVDITNLESAKNEIKNSDIIIHLASISRVDPCQAEPIRCYEVNVLAVLKIIELVKKSKTKIIFGSSREVYGEAKKIPVEESHEKNPLTVYGSSKLAAEQLLKTYRKLYGLDFVTLRFANVYGSTRDLPDRVIPRFIELARKGESFIINGGEQVVDFTFIDDVIDGISKLIAKISSDSNVIGEDYNFATRTGTSVKDLAPIVKKIFNSNSKLVFKDKRDYDVQNFVGDYTKAKNAFSFEPKNSLFEGLEKYKKSFDGN